MCITKTSNRDRVNKSSENMNYIDFSFRKTSTIITNGDH